MRANRLKAIWQAGGIVWNGWLHIPSSWSAEVMAQVGWDSLTIDMQHGFHSLETAMQMLQAISTTETVPLARVTWNEPGMTMRLLDAGAYGIICPMVETRADCEAFVGACRYPPLGYRSLGPTRARVYAGEDYALHANDEIVTFAMVETQRALDNLDEIASVAGLDGIFVGPGDLYLSLTGKIGMDVEDPVMDAALNAVVAACRENALIPGIFTGSAAYARKMAARGFRFITLRTDTLLLTEAGKTILNQAKSSEKEE